MDWLKTPYAYASADATPLFIIAMNDYVTHSGDIGFAQQKWDNLSRAYEFLRSTYDAIVLGSGCAAMEGHHRMMAILGTSDHCIATHPSDMCVAMTALEAVIHVQGAKGTREIAIGEFYKLPGDTPGETVVRDMTFAQMDQQLKDWKDHKTQLLQQNGGIDG